MSPSPGRYGASIPTHSGHVPFDGGNTGSTQESNVFKLAQATAAKLGDADLVESSDVRADCGYIGEGYGLPAASTIEAIRVVAEQEGILLDPVYSGKGMAGLIGLIGSGVLTSEHKVLFVHTGGSVALFGYAHRLDLPAAQAAE